MNLYYIPTYVLELCTYLYVPVRYKQPPIYVTQVMYLFQFVYPIVEVNADDWKNERSAWK